MATTNKELNVRLHLKYDTLANWTAESNQFILGPGEMACVAISENRESNPQVTSAPTVLFKVGDGAHTFNELQWASAKAADVQAWAKKANPTLSDLPEVIRTALTNLNNGKVNSVTAGDTTVTIGGTATNPTVAANISASGGNRLINQNGLYVAPAAVGLINSEDKVISTQATSDGSLNIKTNLGLNYDSTNKKLELIGKDNAVVDSIDVTAFVKDGMIKSADYADGKITLTFNTENGVDEDPIEIDVSELINIYTAGNGLALNGSEFSVKKDSSSEAFLSVGANGVKVSGIQDAINTAKNAVLGDSDDTASDTTVYGVKALANSALTLAGNASNAAAAINLTQDSTDGHKLTFTNNGGTATTIIIPDNNTTYTAGNGMVLTGTAFSVKKDSSSESYLTVGANGVKVSGIDTINTLATSAHTRLDRINISQDATDGHKITFSGTDSTHDVTITIPDNDTTYSAGTGLSLNGTTFNHSNSVTAQSAAAFKKVSYDAQGHITGSADVTAADIPTLTLAKISDAGAAAAKGVDTTIKANSENLITSGAVSTSINTLGNSAQAMANTAESNAKAFATEEAGKAEQNAKDYADQIVQSFGGTVGDGTVTLSGDNSITASGSFTLNQAGNASLTVSLKNGGVTTDKIADLAVTGDKIAIAAITEAKIDDGAVTTSKIGDGKVTKSKLDTSVQTSLAAADSALQTVSAGTGLKVSAKSGNNQTIDIDESIVFVFNCGSATALVDNYTA